MKEEADGKCALPWGGGGERENWEKFGSYNPAEIMLTRYPVQAIVEMVPMNPGVNEASEHS